MELSQTDQTLLKKEQRGASDSQNNSNVNQEPNYSRIPVKSKGLVPRMTLSYLNKIVDAGNREKYNQNMLFKVEPHFTFRTAYEKLSELMQKSGNKMTWMTIFWFNLDYIIKFSFLEILDNILSLIVAFLTSKLISWIQVSKPDFSQGALLTSLVVLGSLAKVFLYNWYNVLFYEIQKYLTNGLRVITTLIFLNF